VAIKNIFKRKQWKADYDAGRDAFNAGQFKAAETHLRSAMGKAIELDDSAYGDTALLLGQVMRRLERYDESLELTEKAFNYYNGFFGTTDQRTVAAHLSLVLADPRKAHSDPSLRQATHHQAVEQFGSKSWQVVRTAAIALGQLTSTEREKALGLAQDALAHALGEGRQELGAWPPVAEEFALELSRLGYTDLAARFMANQLRVHEELHGVKSEEAALTRLTLGELFLQCGEWAKAETALSKALEQIKLRHGPKSDLARRGTICLGQALARQGRLEQAAPYLTESLEKLRGDQGTERLEALVWLLEYKCMIAASDAERGALWRELEMAWESNPTEAARSRIYQGFCDAQRRLMEACRPFSIECASGEGRITPM
jgi:tetratricopeptide (TPR) repeat protein